MKTAPVLVSLATLILGWSPLVSVQAENTEPLLKPNPEGEFQRNELNSNGGSTFGNGFDPLQLIHNHNLRRSRSGSDFAEDSVNHLNNAAEEYKKLQQQRLLEQSNTVNP